MILLTGHSEGCSEEGAEAIKPDELHTLFYEKIWDGLNTLHRPRNRRPNKSKFAVFAISFLKKVALKNPHFHKNIAKGL